MVRLYTQACQPITPAVTRQVLLEFDERSSLALHLYTLEEGTETAFAPSTSDRLLFPYRGGGVLTATVDPPETRRSWFVPAGEQLRVAATTNKLELLVAEVGADCDTHAPLGPITRVAAGTTLDKRSATGSRTFQIVFGPEQGCSRATLFIGFVPPGRAPWHFHQYDEIVVVLNGHGTLHLETSVEPLEEGCVFRLRPREIHIVENHGAEDLSLLGLFTPAGSPAAAYLAPA